MVRSRSGRATLLITALVTAIAIPALAGCVSRSNAANQATPTPVWVEPSTAEALPLPTPSPSPSPSPSTSPSPSVPPAPTPTRKPTTKPPTKPAGTKFGPGPGGSATTTGTAGVALTYDDGPDPTYTPQILDLLRAQKVKATFCLVGFRARDYPALVRRIVAEGHTLCNHSWQHLFDLSTRGEAYIRKDLKKTNDAIQAAVPGAKIQYFRAPGGNFTKPLVAIAKSMGMKSIYWAVDPRDWDSATYGNGQNMVNHIISNVKNNVGPGAIILSHDLAKPNTITAYQTLLPWLKARYKLIPLPVTTSAPPASPPPPPAPTPSPISAPAP